jgi:hypothetical protein
MGRGERQKLTYTHKGDEVLVGEESTEIRMGTINCGGEGIWQLEAEEEEPRNVGYRDRIGCYTWTWFTMTMATGGIANVLHSSMCHICFMEFSFV